MRVASTLSYIAQVAAAPTTSTSRFAKLFPEAAEKAEVLQLKLSQAGIFGEIWHKMLLHQFD